MPESQTSGWEDRWDLGKVLPCESQVKLDEVRDGASREDVGGVTRVWMSVRVSASGYITSPLCSTLSHQRKSPIISCSCDFSNMCL